MAKLIPVSAPSITEAEVELVADAVRSGWVSSLGVYVDRFEAGFAAFCGTKYGIATSNGTTALHLALLAHGIQPGDEVIVPDLTFVATANVVRHAGAVPVLVDVDRETLGLDPERVRAAITPRTRAVMPVHLYGHPADMRAINRIAEAHDLFVIEDAAEAHGAEIEGRRVGSWGDSGVFSFYGNKIVTCGEGGLITTDDPAFYERARHLRDHAMSPTQRYWHDEVGYNYRITNIQAALGVAQMQRIDALIARRRAIFAKYEQELRGVPRLRLNRNAPWARNVFWMICVEVDGIDRAGRDQLLADLRARGIDGRPYFYPMSDLPMYARADTPVSHDVSQRGLNLPTFDALTDGEIELICRELKSLIAR